MKIGGLRMPFDVFQPMVLIALGAATSIIALSYMLGEFFSMPTLKGFAKVELTELGVTAVILLIIALLAVPGGPFDIFTQAFVHPSVYAYPNFLEENTCPEWRKLHNCDISTNSCANGNLAFGFADYFLGCRLNVLEILGSLRDLLPIFSYTVGEGIIMPRILGGYMDLTGIEIILSILSTLDFGLHYPILGFGLTFDIHSIVPFIQLTLASEANIMVADALMAVWAAFAAQKMLLSFIETGIAPVFALGVVFRAFPFSRKTGSTIIAVLIAAYFVYPISILINQHIFYMIVAPYYTPSGTTCSAEGEFCTDHKDCCSNRCVNNNCTSLLTNFREYKSIYKICGQDPRSINTQQALESWQSAAGQQWQEYQEAIEATSAESDKPVTKIDPHMITEIKESMDIGNIPKGWRHITFNLGEMAKQGIAYRVLENSLTDAGNYIVLATFFIVLEIVITLTLMKDIAILIGGEPRILGITKLV